MESSDIVRMLSEKCETTNQAKRVSKKYYGNACIISGQVPDGAHIFNAGSYPQLKNYPANIVPVARWHHSTRGNQNCMDYNGNRNRTPGEKIQWLKSYVIDPYAKALLRVQFLVLHTVLENEGVIYDFGKELIDYE